MPRSVDQPGAHPATPLGPTPGRPGADPSRPGPAQAGFTLLEVMFALLVVGWASAQILQAREVSSNLAFKAGKQIQALQYAEQILARSMLSTDTWNEYESVIEDDPVYRYTLTVEEFNLSTGRASDEDDELNVSGGFGEFETAFVPGDAATNEEPEFDPHAVRRFKIVMHYPSLLGDQDEELTLETFIPAILDEEQQSNLK